MEKISNQCLKIMSLIDNFSLKIHEQNDLCLKAANGKLTRDILGQYLFNIHHLICQTSPNLKLAKQQAISEGNHHLAKFCDVKHEEEKGHQLWALDDLNAIGFNSIKGFYICDSMRDLERYMKSVAMSDSLSYLTYAFFAEYFTVKAAPRWVENISKHCDIPNLSITVLTKHIELDKQHIVETIDEFNEIITGADIPKLTEVITTSFELFNKTYNEIAKFEVINVKSKTAYSENRYSV